MAKDINIKVGADISELEKKLNKAARTLKRSGQQMSRMGNDLIMSLSAPLAALGGVALQAAGDFEAMSNGLTAIMGDADAAAAELEKLKEAAKNPGLGLNQAVQGSVRLQSIGINAEAARKNMLSMGNAIALVGGGANELDRATLAIQQIGAKGKVSAEEINQLNEVIPQIRAVMKDMFGTADTEQLQKMGIDANTFIEGITVGLQKLPTATGGIKNAIENAGIAMTGFLSSLGTELNEAFNIQENVDSFSETLAGLSEKFANLDNGIKRAIFSFAGLLISIGPVIKMMGIFKIVQSQVITAMSFAVGKYTKVIKLLRSFTSVQAALNAVMLANPIGAIVVAVATLSAAFYLLYQNSETFKNAVDALFNQVLKPFGMFLYELGKIGIEVFQGIIKIVMDTAKVFGDLFKTAADGIGDFLQRIPLIGKAVDFLKKAFRGAVQFIGKIFANLPAFFAGMTAEAKETGDKIIRFFQKIALSAQITAKKVQRALTVGADARAAIDGQIKALAAKRAKLGEEGKKFGEAFRVAYNEEIKKVDVPKVSVATKTAVPSLGTSPMASFTPTAAVDGQKKLKTSTDATTKAIKEQNTAVTENATALGTLNTFQVETDTLNNAMASSTNGLSLAQSQFNETTGKMREQLAEFNAGLTDIVNTGLADLATGLGEGLGAMAAGTANMGTMAASLLGTIGGVLGQLGKMAIQTGIAIGGIQLALKSLNPAVAIAGGVALVALSKLVQSKASSMGEKFGGGVTALAEGGILTKPVFSQGFLAGEAGPEAVIPLSKLGDMFGGSGGNDSLKVEFPMDKMVIALDRQRKRNGRV